jgi:hypothetical protein
VFGAQFAQALIEHRTDGQAYALLRINGTFFAHLSLKSKKAVQCSAAKQHEHEDNEI